MGGEEGGRGRKSGAHPMPQQADRKTGRQGDSQRQSETVRDRQRQAETGRQAEKPTGGHARRHAGRPANIATCPSVTATSV